MSLLAAFGGDTVKIFDASDKLFDSSVKPGDPCTFSFTPSPGFQVNSAKWNHSNMVAASAGDDNRISFGRKNGHIMGTIPVDNVDNIEESILAVNFSNKASRYMCSRGSDQVVKIWDLQRKRDIKKFKGHTNTVTGVMYNCKDEHLAPTAGISFSPSNDKIIADDSLIVMYPICRNLTSLNWSYALSRPKFDKSHAFDAAVSALAVFGVAGELGMKMAKGPASLRMNLIDALYGLDEATLQSHVKWILTLNNVLAPSVAICSSGIRGFSSANPLAFLNFPMLPSTQWRLMSLSQHSRVCLHESECRLEVVRLEQLLESICRHGAGLFLSNVEAEVKCIVLQGKLIELETAITSLKQSK
ncbi:hypothetical protein KIW84_020158 [Lathyrus oleraceus]|uniref:Uncharacterized protein n=1 Tax=Pisum sativum TaxID=3888 RepID=A0A9D4Y4C4_PEA|nr:hypothetical protein KIW84_020158 [Pisum sativum]